LPGETCIVSLGIDGMLEQVYAVHLLVRDLQMRRAMVGVDGAVDRQRGLASVQNTDRLNCSQPSPALMRVRR